MELFGVVICALGAAVLGAVVQKGGKEFSLALAGITAVLIFVRILGQLEPLIRQLEGLTAVEEYVSVLLKAVGITLLGKFGGDFCRDAGESALASGVELASGTAILLTALPILTGIFEYLEKIVSF